jgi:hypothetical protein
MDGIAEHYRKSLVDAIKSQDIESVLVALERAHGAYPLSGFDRDNDGCTVLLVVSLYCAHISPDILQAIMHPIHSRFVGEVDDRSHAGFTALEVACLKLDTPRIIVLIDAGANVNSIGLYGRGPLHYACEWTSQHHHREQVINLLLDNHADINAHSQHGFTPLYCCVRRGFVGAARLLIERGADMSVGHGADPLLHLAMNTVRWSNSTDENMQLDIIELLILHGADIHGVHRNQTIQQLASSESIQGLHSRRYAARLFALILSELPLQPTVLTPDALLRRQAIGLSLIARLGGNSVLSSMHQEILQSILAAGRDEYLPITVSSTLQAIRQHYGRLPIRDIDTGVP